jgi:hypothetical protein
MANYANNMSPTATAGAYTQPNTGVSPWANNAPTYTSPAYTSPADYSPIGQDHVHSHMHYGQMKSSGYGGASSVGIILVLFILLVIISRACFI